VKGYISRTADEQLTKVRQCGARSTATRHDANANDFSHPRTEYCRQRHARAIVRTGVSLQAR
jgi:hypothetical protein